MSKPTYVPTTWIDHVEDPATGEVLTLGTEVNAEHLNKMEQGIKGAVDAIGETDTDLSGRDAKATIADGDAFLLADSETETPVLKRALWSTVKARMKGFLEDVFVPLTRKVNGRALSADITLSAEDAGAAPVAHASSAQTYGVGTTAEYGHVKVTSGNGLTVSGGVISMAAASASAAGAVTTGAQTFAGAKTFSGAVVVSGQLTPGNPAVGTQAARRIYAGTGAMTDGVTALAQGLVYFQI